MRERLLMMAGFLGAAALAWALTTLVRDGESDEADGWDRQGAAEVAGFESLEKWGRDGTASTLRRLPTDPASNFLEEWMIGAPGDAKELVRAAESAVGMPDRLDDADPGWGKFYNGLTDPFFMHDVVSVCGPRVSPSERCHIGVRVVASPKKAEDGLGSKAEYASVAGTEPNTKECRRYASCVAHAMLGRDLPPLPAGYDEPQGTDITWAMDAWDETRIQENQERIDECIAVSQEALGLLATAEMESQEDKSYQVESYESRLRWCEMLSDDLNDV
ncbi:MAG: hypothetical protein ACRBN8_40780 [Nannocystales bacterium]